MTSRACAPSTCRSSSSPASIVMDFVFTVCDAAAAEECPPWPGQPITGHWGLPDPVKATGTEGEKALVFAQTYAALRRRIAAFVELPFDSLSRLSLQSHVDAIGCRPLPTRADRDGTHRGERPWPDRKAPALRSALGVRDRPGQGTPAGKPALADRRGAAIWQDDGRVEDSIESGGGGFLVIGRLRSGVAGRGLPCKIKARNPGGHEKRSR